MFVEQKSLLTLVIIITNKLIVKYRLYISSNSILAEGILSIQGKILKRNFFIALFSLFLVISGTSLKQDT